MTITAAPARPRAVADDIRALIADAPVDELADRLTDLFEARMQPLTDRATAYEVESTRAAEDGRRAHYVLGQVQALAAHQISTLAQHGATIAHQGVALRQIRKLAQGAFEGRVSADDLMALLNEEIPEPTFVPVVLGFHPSSAYRAGQFATADGRIRSTFQFIGWSTVVINPTGGVQTQPTFLVGDRGALPAGVIEVERGMALQLPLLPNVALV